MQESRITKLLMQARSRHATVDDPELRRISQQWQQHKRHSLKSENDFKKLMRELNYYEQLNQRLHKEVCRGKKKVKLAQSIRQRYLQDLKQKQDLARLREEQRAKNEESAAKIRQSRKKRIRAMKKDLFEKMQLGEASRCQSRRLREAREESRFEDYLRNRSRVEEVTQFENDLRASAVRKKELEVQAHIQRHRQSIQLQKDQMHSMGIRSMELKKKLRSLTEASSGKVKILQDMRQELDRYRSPYYLPLYRGKQVSLASLETEKPSLQRSDHSTMMLSQPSYV